MEPNPSLEEIYDRQLRLWGHEGQRGINDSIVCILGADSLACDFAKSLVLTGIGKIILIDDAKVTEEDIKVNFFVRSEDKGRPLCEAARDCLQVMNDYIQIEAKESPKTDLEILDPLPEYSFIVTTSNLGESFLNRLSNKCREHKWRQVHIQSQGFFSELAIDGGFHPIIEGYSEDPEKFDLRLTNPFPELEEFFNNWTIPKIANEFPQFLPRLPFPIMFWDIIHRFNLPISPDASSAESRQAFNNVKTEVNNFKARDPLIEEEVFEEINNNCLYSIATQPYKLPSNVEILFQKLDEIKEQNVYQDSPYWPIFFAIREFYNRHSVLPHFGILKDFTAAPDLYQNLKHIYKQKSFEDESEINSIILEQNDGLTIDPIFIHRVVLAVNRIDFVIFKPLSNILGLEKEGQLEECFTEEEIEKVHCEEILRRLFAASRIFKDKYKRDPGSLLTEWKKDESSIIEILGNLDGFNEELVLKYTEAFCHMKGLLISPVSSVIAGIASQEVIKIASNNSTPLKDGLFIQNMFWQTKGFD